MIHGVFGDEGQLFFEIELVATNGSKLPMEIMLDTGFTGFLAMNKQDLNGFGWNYLRRDKLRTAQGESKFSIYQGKILLDGQEYEIPVYANNQLTETLLGSEWLKILPLSVNYQAGILTLGE